MVIIRLVVNILGSFFFGFILNFSNYRSDSWTHYLLLVGIAGAFTTFSTFSLEVIELLAGKKLLMACSYMFLSLSVCLLFTYIGLNFNKFIN